MKTEVILNYQQDTEKLAAQIGDKLRGGECFEFISDLGGGKTTFVRGLVSGAGSLDMVGSPTFTISKHYSTKNVNFYHYDFYRLSEAGLVAEELSEALEDTKGVALIEWAETVEHVLPPDRIIVKLDKLSDNPEGRKCVFEYSEKYSYLFKGVV